MSRFDEVTAYAQSLPNWAKAVIAAGGVVVVGHAAYKWYASRPRQGLVKPDWREGVVYLFQAPRSRNMPCFSPYSLKLETWLRIADIPYEIPDAPLTVRSHEGTLPFVEYNGVEYSDSSFIIRELTRAFSKERMEDHLNEEQRAASRAFEKLIELSLFSSHLVFRVDNLHSLFQLLNPAQFGFLFPVTKHFATRYITKKISAVLEHTGIGAHSREEQIAIGSDDIRALSRYLGTKHYFTGFKPTRIDATVFGFLVQIIYAPYDSEHLHVIKEECPNLVEFVDRIKKRYWPDWDAVTNLFSTNTNWRKRRGPRSEYSPRTSISGRRTPPRRVDFLP